MKLCRFGIKGQEKPGIIDNNGNLRDLSTVINDIDNENVRLSKLNQLKNVIIEELPLVTETPRFGIPVNSIGKIIAVGLNYADHAKESNLPIPSEPILFTKAISSLNGPNDDVIYPLDATKMDWEVELGVIIGKTCRYVPLENALEYVAGYVLANDISERGFQKERGTQWDKGKGCDTFCPVGPYLVTKDEIPDPQDLGMYLNVNGKRMQTGNTKTMIFSVAECISYISRFITLEPGDLLITGTPPGVGEGQKPNSIYLKVGDKIELGIDKLGVQNQTIIDFKSADLEYFD